MAEGHRQRMRERFYNEGIDHFEPHEALEMLLYFAIPRKDTNPLAHQLIEHFGSFHGVLEAKREDLIKFGLSESPTALLNMLPSFMNYYMQSRVSGTPYLADITDTGNYAVNKLGERTYEVFGVICMTAQRKLINFEIIETGTVSTTTVSPRKVVECALSNNAARIVLTHNHPGGSLYPSEDDRKLTKQLITILEPLNISVTDHIIVANGRFLSMREQGML